MTKHDQSSSSYDAMFASGGYQGVYDLPYRHSAYFPLFRAALRELKRAQVSSVLEVGCGTGAFAHYVLDDTDIQYRGFDFSQIAVEKARTRTAHPDLFFVGDATQPHSYQSSYEAIVCTEVLEHVPDDLSVPANWPSGTLCVCSVPNFDADNHERFFRSEAEVATRYGALIDIHQISRVKKPPIADISVRSYLRAVRWNRYRPDQLLSLFHLSPFDDMGGWFVFVGRKK